MKGVQDVVKPTVTLSNGEENIYSLIGEVSKALNGAGLGTQVDEFVERSISAPSYGAVLELSREYVEFPRGGSNEPATN